MNSKGALLPVINTRSAPFWAAARRHELRLPSCVRCGALHTYFERWCATCGHDEYEWRLLSGRGVVWSFCVFHKAYFPEFASQLPYNVAQVELAEGPRLVTNLVGMPHKDIRIGMPVEVCFDDVADDVALIKFQAADRG